MKYNFFDIDIIQVIKELINNNIRVICAGLSVNFRGELFNAQMGRLMAMAEKLDKLTAICKKCGNPAIYNQRFVNGLPAKYNDPLVIVGGEESYEARCYNCFDCEKNNY